MEERVPIYFVWEAKMAKNEAHLGLGLFTLRAFHFLRIKKNAVQLS